MRKISLADAKAHLSELVDEAEHRGKRIVILRHGKPAAAIVPVAVAAPRRRARKRWTEVEARRSVEAFIAEFSAAQPEVSAVDDLLAGRR
ncbi:MAG TPA: type II toxin-antitoxin system Phd/YefM family antitoxin [Polyangiaceae bacterium]